MLHLVQCRIKGCQRCAPSQNFFIFKQFLEKNVQRGFNDLPLDPLLWCLIFFIRLNKNHICLLPLAQMLMNVNPDLHCANNTVCTNLAGSYHCACADGYTMNNIGDQYVPRGGCGKNFEVFINSLQYKNGNIVIFVLALSLEMNKINEDGNFRIHSSKTH